MDSIKQFFRVGTRPALAGMVGMVLLLGSVVVDAAYRGPQRLDPTQGLTPTLDNRVYQDEAWLVYTWDVNTNGRAVNAKIRLSNGVTAVESAVLDHIQGLRYQPATRDGLL